MKNKLFKRITMVFCAVAISIMVAVPTGAARIDNSGWQVKLSQSDPTVEQQTNWPEGIIAYNLTTGNAGIIPSGRCGFDADDHGRQELTPPLRRGQTFTTTWCFVANALESTVSLSLTKNLRGTLTVTDVLDPSRTWTTTFDSGTQCFLVDYKNTWLPEGNTFTIPWGDVPYIEPYPYDTVAIPGGGIGRIWRATYTVTALKSTQQDFAWARWSSGYPERIGCPRVIDFEQWTVLKDWVPWSDGLSVWSYK